MLRIAMIDWRMYGNPDKSGRPDQMDSVCRTNRWMILSFVITSQSSCYSLVNLCLTKILPTSNYYALLYTVYATWSCMV